MIDSGRKQKIPQQLSGKAPVIIITVFFSCLSLTLGYFVGKMGAVNRTEIPVPQVETLPAQQSSQPHEGQAAPQVEPLKTNVSATDQPGETGAPEQPTSGNATAEVKPAKPAKEPELEPVKETPRGPVQGTTKGSAVKPDRGEFSYTVQLGAFRNRPEAERFMAKYSQKGYKIYITTLKTKNNLKIYKVKTGEFRERKDADILSLKLKKTEGLNAFVAPAHE